MKILRKSLVLVLAMVLLLGLTNTATLAEGVVVNENISGKLVFWTQDNITWTTWFEPAVERFRKAYPNIEVVDEYFPSFANKMTQAYSAGEVPDVAQTWQGVSHWANAGKLLPVPESFALEDNFFEGAIVSKKLGDKYYCVPSEINIESPSLLVNMDLLASMGKELPAGWVENNGPDSWAELLEFARELTIIQDNIVVQSGLAYTYGQWEAMFVSLIWQYGGDYRNPESLVVNFDTPEARKALEFMLKYNDVKDPDCISDRGNSRYDLFVQNSAVMCVGAPWYTGSLAIDAPDMNYQVFNMPAMVEGSVPYSLATGGWGYIVSSSTKYPEAAWAFVEFMSSPEQIGDWAVHCGTLSARKDAVMSLEYDPNVGSVQKALSIAGSILPYGQEDGAYMLSPSQLIYNIVRVQLQQVLETGDIDTALKTMELEGNAMIKENLNR